MQSFAEKPKTPEALNAMKVDTTVLGESRDCVCVRERERERGGFGVCVICPAYIICPTSCKPCIASMPISCKLPQCIAVMAVHTMWRSDPSFRIRISGLTPEEAAEKPYIASMGIYVFKKDLLVKLLQDVSDEDMGCVIPWRVWCAVLSTP